MNSIAKTDAAARDAREGDHNIAADHDAVIAAALDYVFGVATKDLARIERGFEIDKAQMKLIAPDPAGGERVFTVPIRQVWEKVWSQSPGSPDHTAEVLNLTVTEGRMASITINSNNVFIDQLHLYKLNGRWKIVDKLAIRHPKAEPLDMDLEAIFGPQ